MHIVKITFLADVDEYKTGEDYELPRNVARQFIRSGVAKRSTLTKKKTTIKKERATTKPSDLEEAIE